jgi:hypothetical protein
MNRLQSMSNFLSDCLSFLPIVWVLVNRLAFYHNFIAMQENSRDTKKTFVGLLDLIVGPFPFA